MNFKELLKQIAGWILFPYVKIPRILYQKWEQKYTNKYIRGLLVTCIGILLFPIWSAIMGGIIGNNTKTNKVDNVAVNSSIPTSIPKPTNIPTIAPTNTPTPTPTPIPTLDPKAVFNSWVSSQFSSWDGSCRPLVKLVKENMNDPDSFDHVETRYSVDGEVVTIIMKYRGTNAFGGKILAYTTAKMDYKTQTIKIVE